ncbi:uncharacterized protein LOC110057947 [Orbicella faveolata]|uniref:uncharacterized protein LOC110057947 n=1 Tax=Orbicella faveolata TaxID=48498 RepID=UPI0009E3E6BC|nr:uncharacterized protein LOC110057947 [Orbicella faveolata]
MFNSLQLAICIGIILRPVSFARKISLEDETAVIREFNEFTPRKIPRYNLFQQSRRDGGQLPEVACLPHPEVVQVEPNVKDQRNTPQFVTVNRCKGACDLPLNTETCTPIKKRDISVEVSFADGTSQPRYVEDHLECACKCQKGLDCKAHHEFDEQNCRCVCKKMCGGNENQDPVTCRCTAREGKRRYEIIEY